MSRDCWNDIVNSLSPIKKPCCRAPFPEDGIHFEFLNERNRCSGVYTTTLNMAY